MPYDNPAEARRHGFVPGSYKRLNPSSGQNGSLSGGAGFNRGAAGSKSYGMGRAAPNMGKTAHKAGYGKRDNMRRARANAIEARLKGM